MKENLECQNMDKFPKEIIDKFVDATNYVLDTAKFTGWNEEIIYKENVTENSYRAHILANEQFIGNVKLVPLPKNVKRDLPKEYHNWFYLADISVKPEYRGRGLGASLLERVISFSKEKGKPILLVA